MTKQRRENTHGVCTSLSKPALFSHQAILIIWEEVLGKERMRWMEISLVRLAHLWTLTDFSLCKFSVSVCFLICCAGSARRDLRWFAKSVIV